MIRTTTTARVRYAETDKMGVVYYANYAIYFEIGRTDMFRQIGYTYERMESEGIMLPVVDLHITYKKPARYDDELTIITELREMPTAKIKFYYEIKNSAGDSLCTGETTLVFCSIATSRPMRVPNGIASALQAPLASE